MRSHRPEIRPLHHVERVLPDSRRVFTNLAGPRYNTSPATRPLMLDRLIWGGGQPTSNSWCPCPAVQDPRQRLAADGSYEWKLLGGGRTARKQPHYIYATDNVPPFFGGQSNRRPDAEKEAAHGFIIATDDVADGMIDVHAPPDG